MSRSNAEIMRAFLALWSSRDARAMAGYFAGDGVYDNVPDKQPMVGPAAIQAWLEMCFEHLTRLDVEILNVAGDGEWILSEGLDDNIAGDRHMPLPMMEHQPHCRWQRSRSSATPMTGRRWRSWGCPEGVEGA